MDWVYWFPWLIHFDPLFRWLIEIGVW